MSSISMLEVLEQCYSAAVDMQRKKSFGSIYR